MHDGRSAIAVRNRGTVGRVTTMLDRCRYAVTAPPHDGTALQAIGMALGGQVGARLTQRLGLAMSRDTFCIWCAVYPRQ